MRKVFFILMVFIIAVTTQVRAQEMPKGAKENFSWQKGYMDEAGIPADIQAKIDSIKGNYEIKLKQVRKDAALPEDVKKEKSKELHKQKAEEIFALLTKEQKEKIRAIKDRLKKEAGGS